MKILYKLIQIAPTKVIWPVTQVSLLNAISFPAIHGGMMQRKKTILSMFQPNPTIDMFLQSFCLYEIRFSLPPIQKIGGIVFLCSYANHTYFFPD